MSFDSLTFARRLKSAGFTEAQAEALADANREMVVQDTATKDDIAMVKTEITALEQKLQAVIENQTLRLTVRMGVMLTAGLSIATALIKFH
jgi:hypothetical protein